jgi:hypothetical protein
MNFRLNLHTSATTTLEPYEIRARIQLELKDKKYNVESVTDKSVLFKDNPWRLRSNWSPYMLDGGEFVISDDYDNGELLTLNYYWSYLPFLLIFSFLTITLILEKEYDGIWFFGVFYAIVVPIDIMRSKNKASELIAAILRTDI